MTITKGFIAKEDIKFYDGRSDTFTRYSSTGGTAAYTRMDHMGSVDVLFAYGDGSTLSGTAINDAISAIGTTTKTGLYLQRGTWTVSANITVPANLTLIFAPGAMLSVDSGKTVTINSPQHVIAPESQQVFSGAGTVSFTNGGRVYVKWFGAAFDNSSDDYGEILAAVNSLPSAGGVVDMRIAGSSKISSRLPLKSSIIYEGLNQRITYLKYTGVDGELFNNLTGGRIYSPGIINMSIYGNDATGTTTGVKLYDVSSGTFENLTIYGFTGIGLHLDASVATYYNRFTQVTASTCGIGIKTKAYCNANWFHDCRANACTDIGLDVEDGTQNLWINMATESNTNEGIKLSASGATSCLYPIFIAPRIERNGIGFKVDSSDVVGTVFVYPYFVDNTDDFDIALGAVITMDVNRLNDDSYGLYYARNVGDAGPTYYFERKATSSNFPALEIKDSATTSGNPVTCQVTTERATGYFFRGQRSSTTYFEITAAGNINQPEGSYIEGAEMTAPSAPDANKGRMFFRDSGAGKTQLCVRFATGAIQVIASEP